jgi:1,2-phenylacetyl-CoA epoxidase catalytic subunit
MQAALDVLWPYCAQLFVEAPEALAAADLLPDRSRLRGTWEERVNKVLEHAGLNPPDSEFLPIGRGEHTERLREILDEMQRVARLQEGVSW